MAGTPELSGDGKALKYFALEPFELRVTAGVIVDALNQGTDTGGGPGGRAEPAVGGSRVAGTRVTGPGRHRRSRGLPGR